MRSSGASVGFVNPGYASYDDYLLYLTLALDFELAYEPRVVMRYRRHAGNLTNVLLAGNTARARASLLEKFLRQFPEARQRLGAERRRTLARLMVAAAAYESHEDPVQATRSAWAGLRHHPPAALGEAGRGARLRLAAARRS